MSARIEQSVELFRQGYNCAQALLVAFGDSCGLERDMALKLALGLEGGLGLTGEVCGAANGACLLLGLDTGTREDPAGEQGRKLARKRVREFLRSFNKQCGAVSCRQLIGLDLGTTTGMAVAIGKRVLVRRCPEYVEAAAKILKEMLDGVNGVSRG